MPAAGFGSGRLGAPSFKQALHHGACVPQLKRRVCSGEHLLCQPDTPSSGPGCLVDTPGGGPGFTVRKKVWPHAPGLGTNPAGEASTAEPAEGCSSPAPGLSASPWQAGWHPCCSHSSVTRPCVGCGRREQNIFWVAVHLTGG